MSIESVGAYSKDTIYGQLTMPFTDKPVHINAHTPLDEEAGDVVLTRNSFYNNRSEGQVSIKDIRDMKSLELDDSLVVDIGIKKYEGFPPKSDVETFQQSSYINGTGVVFSALKSGYTGSEAITIGNAYRAYKTAASLGNNPVQTLINTNFAVS